MAQSPKFIFDTCAFQDAWKYYFPIEVFPGLWDVLSGGIAEGWIRSPKQVRVELKEDKSAEGKALFEWIEDQGSVFLKEEPRYLMQFSKVARVFSSRASFVMDSDSQNADPWILSCAMELNAIPVTHDGLDSSNWQFRPKGVRKFVSLANACEEMGRTPLTMLGFMKRQKLKFATT